MEREKYGIKKRACKVPKEGRGVGCREKEGQQNTVHVFLCDFNFQIMKMNYYFKNLTLITKPLSKIEIVYKGVHNDSPQDAPLWYASYFELKAI